MIRFCLLTAVLAVPCVHAQVPSYSLPELIDNALRHNAEIAEQQWRMQAASTDLQKANAARLLPKFRLEAYTGAVPEAKGNAVGIQSDTTGLRPLGPFLRSEIEFVQPLYVSGAGRIRDAAEEGVRVEQAALAGVQQDVALEIKELYYGVLLADELDRLARDLHKEIEGRLGNLEEEGVLLNLGDQYKLEFARLEIERQAAEVAKQLQLARAALAWKAGLPERRPFALDQSGLEPEAVDLPDLKELEGEAFQRRGDWRQLQAGIAARKAQRDAARGAFMPQLFISGGVRYAVAPNRTDQRNPFVKDEFNLFNFGAVLGVKQSFEFGLLRADLAKREAQYRQLEAQVTSGERGIRLDVRRAYLDLEQAQTELKRMQRSRQLSRQWLREAKEAYEFDPEEEAKGLIAAVEAWAQTERQYFQSVFDYNMAIAHLEHTAGGVTLKEAR